MARHALAGPPWMKDRVVQVLLRACALLPFRLSQALGAALGWLHWRLPNRLRRISADNIARCYPGHTAAWRRRLLRASLIATGQAFAECAWFWGRGAARSLALVREVRDDSDVEQLVRAGRGIVFATPHFGAWELAGAWAARQAPLTVLFRPPRVAALAAILRRGRQRLGMQPVATDAAGVRALHRSLKTGDAVGMLPDQQPRAGQGVYAPFFGQPALTMTLLSRLAHRSGAAVVFLAMERLPRGRGFRVHAWRAHADVADADPETAAAAVNREVERCIALAPAQYTWNYKRFRRPG